MGGKIIMEKTGFRFCEKLMENGRNNNNNSRNGINNNKSISKNHIIKNNNLKSKNKNILKEKDSKYRIKK